MDRIGGPLKNLLDRLRLTGPMKGWEAVELWPKVVGERIAARTRARAFRDGTLTVEVESAAWMNEMTYLKRRLIQDLNQRLGAETVQDIRWTLQAQARGQKTDSRGDRTSYDSGTGR